MTVDAASCFPFASIPWESPGAATGAPEAMRKGVRRKLLAQGEGSFFVQHVEMPAGHRVEPHSHSASELLVVVEGGCQLDDGITLGADDSAVLEAGRTYGFTVGGDGMRFLIVRNTAATMNVASA